MAQVTNGEPSSGLPSPDAADLFVAGVRREFDWMKSPSRTIENFKLWEASSPSVGLVPLTERSITDGLITQLAMWRDRHRDAFGTRFRLTFEGTDQWLRSAVLGNPDRVLFLVVDPSGGPLGNIGLLLRPGEELKTVELDNVLRGRAGGRGAMRIATRVLESWAYVRLGAERIVLRVLATNSRAADFYTDLGYLSLARIPLKEQRSADRSELVTAGPDDLVVDEYLVMKKDRSGLLDLAPPMASTSDGPSTSLDLNCPGTHGRSWHTD